MFFSEPTGLKL